MLVVEFVDTKSAVVPFRVGSSEVMVGDDIFACVDEFVFDAAFVEIGVCDFLLITIDCLPTWSVIYSLNSPNVTSPFVSFNFFKK